MYINTIQALEIAISAIQQLPDTEENRQAIIRLSNMKSQDRYIHWTKELVFEYLDKWKIEHDRNPTVTTLTEPNMPKYTTIQKLFNMKASAFLNIYYPSEERKPMTTKYTVKTEQEWIDDFKEQFDKIQPKSANDYNNKRDKSTPTWLTIARYLGVTKWTELIKITKVNTKCLQIKEPYLPRNFTVDSTNSLYNKLERLLEERKRLWEEYIDDYK